MTAQRGLQRGEQMHALLAQVQEVGAQLPVKKNHGFRSQSSVLGSTKGQDVHSQVPRGLPQVLSQAGGRVRDAGPVHVQEHAALVSKTGDGFYFVRLVNRPHFSGLRDGDDAGLHVVRIADAMVSMTDGFDRKLPVGYGHGNELAAGEFLRSAAFVGVDVGGFAADHRVIRIGQRSQAQAIGRGPVENEEDCNARRRRSIS